MAAYEDKLPKLAVKYPYFKKTPDQDEWIGGYAGEPRKAVNYAWIYTLSEIIIALSQAGLHIEWLYEFALFYFKMSPKRQIKDEKGQWIFPEHKGKVPYTFSLKATVR